MAIFNFFDDGKREPILMSGKKVAEEIKKRVAEEVQELKKQGITPGLAVILVGKDPASETYVKMKSKACKEVGIFSFVHRLPSGIRTEDLLEVIDMLNTSPKIHGILVQLPLPSHIDTNQVLERVAIEKDVDGFHPYNMGRLVEGLDGLVPCTPLGVMELFKAYKIPLEGQDVCIVGASNIVGKPMWALMLNSNATVDICHIYTRDLKEHTRRADILIVGVGKPGLITEDMVKDGAVVVDIGINRVNGKIVGDVDFDRVKRRASYITPVPGGVGPMTIAMLLQNTVKAVKMKKAR
ncbi:MAG: bifunctional methylenetetrahydrofolate dehydrogenase/methenyltetrahydrofolate cyclohydrolase FolD [Epsilonproteobacteria bacterium]|nr:bifunctional methylenetetrahydrofolate dehydrogenase/methenyltetrahydrofolate cyclohydrolase FolD [Campylobacterota bacterium]NPA88843.1 bifunctional methylenetetrahydrofolate dehydrogenase/methenyltetrahydrofolate cyclohydrolase FolD [Campylobacterota bacterium]